MGLSSEEWAKFCADQRRCVKDGSKLAEDQELIRQSPEQARREPETRLQHVLTHENVNAATTEPQNRPTGPQNDRDQPAQRPALEPVLQGQEGHDERPVVRIKGYRVRCLDVDAFPGSCKALIDGLRAASLIPGDAPQDIRLETDQEKVAHFHQERTEIIIVYPES
jgi:hypothetical protein